MPTRVQAKTAIDNGAIALKADIDNIIPSGANIVDGQISFAPYRAMLKLDAGGSSATALSLFQAIQTNFNNASRNVVVRRRDRRVDSEVPDHPKQILLIEATLTVIITNF